jgi:hypothetical protein
MPLGVDHEARAGRRSTFGFRFAEWRERRRRGFLPGDLGFDEGDAVPVAPVDLVDDVGAGKKMIISLRFSWTNVGAPDEAKIAPLYQSSTHISG